MSTENQVPERDYNNLPEHEKRVVEEKSELGQKIIKLHEFIGSNPIFQKLHPKQQRLLKKQLLFMQLYHDILNERIDGFFSKEVPEQISWESKGQELIGIFGTDNWDVFTLKALGAELVDKINLLGKDPRRNAKAGTDIESGLMFAVKSFFSKK